MKTTDREQLKNVILLCLKRGRMTTEDRQKISRFIPVRSYSYTILSLMNGGIDAEKIVEDFEKLTNDEQKKFLNVCTPQPEDDTPPRKLTRDDKILFLNIIQNGMTTRNAERLADMGVNPPNEIFVDGDGKFFVGTIRQIYGLIFGNDY